MAGVILGTLSNRKLIAFAVIMFVLQVGFFLIGGLIAPSPNNVQQLLSNICVDDRADKSEAAWFYPRGKHGRCRRPHSSVADIMKQFPMANADELVFAFQFPLPREGRDMEMSRLHRSMVTVLHVVMDNMEGHDKLEHNTTVEVTIKARLGYSNSNSGNDESVWTEIASSTELRQLSCVVEANSELSCDLMPLFELGSVHYKFYLVNLRFPGDHNANLGPIKEVWAYVIHANRGFTIVWFSIKTLVFPLIAMELVWFIWRLCHMDRKPNVLEQTLIALGAAITLLNIPVDWLTLWIHMPFIMLYSDICQVIFYSVLFCFWVIFTGEHITDQMNRNHIVCYWKQLCVVGFGCVCLFVFEMCERGVQLTNPFYSIWATVVGKYLGLSFIILAGVAACIYFIYLLVVVVKVFRTIMAKKSALPGMSKPRQEFYMGLIYRFSFLMVFTLLCAAMTISLFILGQVSEGHWKWGDAGHLEYTSAVQTGVYGMWNIYVFCLLILYAPSHKYVAVEIDFTSTLDFFSATTFPSEKISVDSSNETDP